MEKVSKEAFRMHLMARLKEKKMLRCEIDSYIKDRTTKHLHEKSYYR